MKRADIIIIGAGVIGLSIARELHRRRAGKILVLERGEVGTEASYAAAGMLAPQVNAGEADAFFSFCAESRDLYPALAGELLEETGVDIELDRTGTISMAFSDADQECLRQRFEWQSLAGLPVRRLSAEETKSLEPSLSSGVREGLFFAGDWQVENRRLMEALREYAELGGVEIGTRTDVRKLLIEKQKVVGVEAWDGVIRCERVIIAAGAWTSLIDMDTGSHPVEIRPVRGQMISFGGMPGQLRHVICGPDGYLVPRGDGRILAGATVEHAGFDKSLSDVATRALRQMALEIMPSLANLDITEIWGGLRPFASDGLPVLGEFSGIDGLTVATGHFRNGILLAPLTARIIADQVLNGLVSPYLKAFGPNRSLAEAASGI